MALVAGAGRGPGHRNRRSQHGVAASDLPSIAGVFNLKKANVPNLLAAFSAMKAGGGDVRIGAQGDSTMFGIGAGDDNYVNAHANSACVQTANLLSAASVPASCDNLWAVASDFNNYLLAEPHFTQSGGGWSGSPYVSIAGAGAAITGGTDATSTITYQTSKSCTHVDAYFLRPTFSYDYAYKVDGGAFSATQTITGGSVGLEKVTIPLGASAPHAITFKSPGGQAYVQGLRFYDTSVRRVLMENMGWPGARSSSWSDTGGFAWESGFQYMNLSLHGAIIQWGEVNDRMDASPASTLQSRLTAAVSTLRGANTDPILFNSHPTSDTATCQAYQTMLQSLSTSLNAPLIDIMVGYPTFAAWTGAGFAWDTLHPSGAGYGYYASLMAPVLQAIHDAA
jgi:hypothetical protein